METGFIATLHDWINIGNSILWGNLMTYLLIGTGIYYTLRLGFPQITGFKHMWHVTLKGRKSEEGGITSFQALCTSLAAQVGTGNVAGVATAIVSGGPGAVFWMWVTALVGMATIYGEAILGQVYRVKGTDGLYRGGPAYYLERGLGQKWLAVLFSISIIIAMPLIFNAVQSNSIVSGLKGAWGFDTQKVGIGVIILTAIVIFGGLRRIAKVAEIVVPFMAILYILGAVYIVLTHLPELPGVIAGVFKCAFGAQQVAGGVLGFTVAQAARFGIARGLFSNEAGMGSTPNANAVADVRHPGRQGYAAMMGVFVDTIIICSCTAVILLLNPDVLTSGKTGVEATQMAIMGEVGQWGVSFVAIALCFFAWTSILGNYYYGESNIMYLFGENKGCVTVFRLCVLGMIYFGATHSVPIVWDMADFFNGIMAMLNLVGVILLAGIASAVKKDYDRRRSLGELDPYIDRSQMKITTIKVELPE